MQPFEGRNLSALIIRRRLVKYQKYTDHLTEKHRSSNYKFSSLPRIFRSMTMVQFKPLLALILFSSCLIIIPFTSAKSTEVHYCNKKANYPVKVSGLEINPYPISRGKNTTFSIAASTEEPISGGKLTVDVTYFIFHVYSEDHNLCSETSCPVSAGDFVVSHSQELPGITPPGSYTLKMTMVDANKKQLTCITFDFSIGFLAPESLADA